MKSMKKIEQFIRAGKGKHTTNPQMDERTIRDSFAAMEQTAQPRSHKIVIPEKFLKPAIVAAAAIIAIGLLIAHWIPSGNQGPGEQPKATSSPTRLLTAASLSITYRRGGMEAVEEQYRQAFDSLGPRPAAITVKELLEEQNDI